MTCKESAHVRHDRTTIPAGFLSIRCAVAALAAQHSGKTGWSCRDRRRCKCWLSLPQWRVSDWVTWGDREPSELPSRMLSANGRETSKSIGLADSLNGCQCELCCLEPCMIMLNSLVCKGCSADCPPVLATLAALMHLANSSSNTGLAIR